MADGLSWFKLLPWSHSLIARNVGRLLLHLLLELCCLFFLLSFLLRELLVLLPGFNSVDSSVGIQSDESGIDQLLEVLFEGLNMIGSPLHDPHLLLHLLDRAIFCTISDCFCSSALFCSLISALPRRRRAQAFTRLFELPLTTIQVEKNTKS